MAVTALLGSGPVMVYFGQESGEPGQGAEGFQGDDGRSTIFDYWGVPKHQNWMNGGKFDGGQLDDAQLSLRKFYKVLLEICNFHEAANHGRTLFLDSGLPKVMAFIRKGEKKQLLVLANFEKSKNIDLKLAIPADVWKEMQLEQKGEYLLADLLPSETNIHFDALKSSTEGIAIQLPAWSAFAFELEAAHP
jgi:glycosidase